MFVMNVMLTPDPSLQRAWYWISCMLFVKASLECVPWCILMRKWHGYTLKMWVLN